MTKLIRIEGEVETVIYCGTTFTEFQARQLFEYENGEIVKKVSSFSFETCTQTELMLFANTGTEE